MIKEPMLSAKMPSMPELLEAMKYPMLGSRKIDGIRAIVSNHEGIPRLYSRKLKLIPNGWAQTLFGAERLIGLDGELVVGDAFGEGVFARSTSGIMSRDGTPDLTYHVFDHWVDKTRDYLYRRGVMQMTVSQQPDKIAVVRQEWINGPDEAEEYHAQSLQLGYEGSMFRHPEAPYKEGRATARSSWLFKCKEWEDAEGQVVGVEQLFHNANEATVNELGRTKRSSHQENMVPLETLGAFIVHTPDGLEFRVGGGPGLTSEMRQHFWQVRDSLIGRTLKYRFLSVGVVVLPRHPQFLGFRED